MVYDATFAETVTITGHGGDRIEAYAARPLDPAPRGGIVVIHHMPGYDRETKEYVRRFAVEGYNAICPNLYWREAPGAAPDDAAATVRAQGGAPDDRVVGDIAGAMEYLKGLSNSNRKVATIGHCSGGRQSWLAGGSLDLDAVICCYPGAVVGEVPAGLPFTPIGHLAATMSGPLLGLFGNDDKFPTPEQVDELDKLLTEAGKPHEFHRYDGAGHAFFGPDRPAYRVEAALDGWQRIFTFLGTHLAG
ncbi:MAG TPA: dienelactone hydrolase family protein [Mycobacteriales bacterium]|nr:dienelactone hydrolase family protein [Mycobacteriales bacterium]